MLALLPWCSLFLESSWLIAKCSCWMTPPPPKKKLSDKFISKETAHQQWIFSSSIIKSSHLSVGGWIQKPHRQTLSQWAGVHFHSAMYFHLSVHCHVAHRMLRMTRHGFSSLLQCGPHMVGSHRWLNCQMWHQFSCWRWLVSTCCGTPCTATHCRRHYDFLQQCCPVHSSKEMNLIFTSRAFGSCHQTNDTSLMHVHLSEMGQNMWCPTLRSVASHSERCTRPHEVSQRMQLKHHALARVAAGLKFIMGVPGPQFSFWNKTNSSIVRALCS